MDKKKEDEKIRMKRRKIKNKDGEKETKNKDEGR